MKLIKRLHAAITWIALVGAAGALNALARIVAPRKKLNIAPHRLCADDPSAGASRPWNHRAWNRAPGHRHIEFGGWTVDACWHTADEIAAWEARV
jgi:hypothetical protein